MDTWTLRDRGRDLAVVARDGEVALSVEGDVTATRRAEALGTVRWDLPADGRAEAVKVELGLRGGIRRVELVEGAAGDPLARLRTPFVPPPGTRARRWHDLRETHPHLHAARHVVFAVVGFLGISALVSAFVRRFVPTIDWSWLPNIELPDISPPQWLRYLDPLAWLRAVLPDWDWFGWLPDLPWQYLVPLAVACAAAVREIDRRRRREQRERRHDEDG